MKAQYGQLMCSAPDQKLCALLFALHAPHIGRTQYRSIFLPEYLGRGWEGGMGRPLEVSLWRQWVSMSEELR